jgi:hypothetical protein
LIFLAETAYLVPSFVLYKFSEDMITDHLVEPYEDSLDELADRYTPKEGEKNS